MPSNMKKYLITAVTLGLIAAGGALLMHSQETQLRLTKLKPLIRV